MYYAILEANCQVGTNFKHTRLHLNNCYVNIDGYMLPHRKWVEPLLVAEIATSCSEDQADVLIVEQHSSRAKIATCLIFNWLACVVLPIHCCLERVWLWWVSLPISSVSPETFIVQGCCPIATSIWTWGVVGRTVLEIICQHWRSVGHSIGNTNGDLTCWNILVYTGDALVVYGVGVSISLARCGRHTGVVTNKGIGLKVVRKCILKTPGFRRDRIEYRDDDLQFPPLVIKWFASCYSQVFLYTELPSSSPVRSLKSSIATHHSYRLRTFLPLETTLTAGSLLLAFASSLLFPLLLPLDWRSLLCSGLSSSSELLKVVGNLQDGIKQWSHASPT